MVSPYVEGALRIEIDPQPHTLVLLWRGTSSARDPDATLRPFFESVAEEARRTGRGVEMRLHALEYFNSSTLASIIRAIGRLRAQDSKVRVAHAADNWQVRSLEALRLLLTHDDHVEIVGVP